MLHFPSGGKAKKINSMMEPQISEQKHNTIIADKRSKNKYNKVQEKRSTYKTAIA
jgi:hypothetical protein